MQHLNSFIQYSEHCDFPIYNLPYGVFLHENKPAHIGVAIGDYVLDLSSLEEKRILNSNYFYQQSSLNIFAAQGPSIWSTIRKRIQQLLSTDNKELQDNQDLLSTVLIPLEAVRLINPFTIGDYTDFYASENHATNVGRLFRPTEPPLLANWKYLPVGYHGRASTIFPSGTAVNRPKGQIKLPGQDRPVFASTKKLDFELEMGVFVGVGNADGKPIAINEACSHIFGMVLLNDWSARDIQAFEYQPLGPFLSKSFATSISPWVVTMEALAPFMVEMPAQSPQPVGYLNQTKRLQPNIHLTVEIQPANTQEATVIGKTTSSTLYWNMDQMLAHHTINGCIMQSGDLFGTGTISGVEQGSWGSMLEACYNGKQPVYLKNGEARSFLEDGDKVIISGYCQNDEYRIGFGILEGTIKPC